jgi:hypothetical protein
VPSGRLRGNPKMAELAFQGLFFCGVVRPGADGRTTPAARHPGHAVGSVRVPSWRGEPAESAAAPMRCRGAAGDAKAGALRPPKLRPAAAAETVRSGSARRLKWLRAARRAAQF